MINKINVSEEKELYDSMFEEEWKETVCIIDDYFVSSKLCTDGKSEWFSYSATVDLVKRIGTYVFIAESLVVNKEDDEPEIEVYADEDTAFIGPCIRKYSCEMELFKKMMKDLAVALFIYAIYKAVEIGDEFTGYHIACIADLLADISNCKDYSGSDILSEEFETALSLCDLPLDESFKIFQYRNYTAELEQHPELLISPNGWKEWKAGLSERFKIENIPKVELQ